MRFTMKTIKKIRESPQDIETIIGSLENYALGDIKYNKPKPISAFILSICFIEQLSYYRYEFHADDSKKPERLINEYMTEYKNLNLYHKTRHTLVHNYSSRGNFDIDNRGFETVPYDEINGVIHINTNVFIQHLESAFEKVVKDFRNVGSEAYSNALEYSMYYPVLVDTYK